MDAIREELARLEEERDLILDLPNTLENNNRLNELDAEIREARISIFYTEMRTPPRDDDLETSPYLSETYGDVFEEYLNVLQRDSDEISILYQTIVHRRIRDMVSRNNFLDEPISRIMQNQDRVYRIITQGIEYPDYIDVSNYMNKIWRYWLHRTLSVDALMMDYIIFKKIKYEFPI